MDFVLEDSNLLHAFLSSDSDAQVAVIYDTELRTWTLTYKDLKLIANIIEQTLRARGYAGGFVGVVMEQREIFPAILLGILQAGMGFYCLETDFHYASELTILQRLNIQNIISDGRILLPQYPIVENLSFDHISPGLTKLHLLGKVSKESGASLLDKPGAFLLVKSGCSSPLDNLMDEPFTLKPFEWAYAIQTSGTTSKRKLVLVSHESIVPNVLDFVGKYHLTRGDIILGASPPTFDPHVVDVFMTLKGGATILYTPKNIKLIPEKLSQLCIKHAVTVLQCTPSLFYRFDVQEAKRFFTQNSNLRILAFGGEPCPSRELLRKFIPSECLQRLSIYNLYGTTELSCWAAANLVAIGSEDHDTDPIGILQTLIPDTFYKVVDNYQMEKEILLGSRNRRCLVMRSEDGHVEPPEEIEDGIVFRRTGDIINLDEFPNLIVYKGRSDNKLKRQGHFVDLHDLEQRLTSIPIVENAICFGNFGSIYAVITFQTPKDPDQFERERCQLFHEIQGRVPIRSLPDHVTVLYPHQVPLTSNGKFDLKKLKHLILDKKLGGIEMVNVTLSEDDVDDILKNGWTLYTGKVKLFPDDLTQTNFIELGGDSVKAMQLVEYIFQELNLFGTDVQQHHSPELLKILIRGNYTTLLNYIRKVILPTTKYNLNVSFHSEDSKISNCQNEETKIDFKNGGDFSVAFNLYGCVDATPILILHPDLGKIAVATSNSGYVIAVKLKGPFNYRDPSGHILWLKKFPDRIVASATISLDQLTLYIACCDCRLYALNIVNAAVNWNFFTGGLLLTCPVEVASNLVIVSADNGWVFGLEGKTGSVTWKLEIPGLKSTLNPHLSQTHIFVATHKGIIGIHSTRGNIFMDYPLQAISTNFASFEGELLCVVTSDAAAGNVLRVLSTDSSNITELWKINIMEGINTPVFRKSETTIHVTYVTSTGRFCVHNAYNGIHYAAVDLNSSIASTPSFIIEDEEKVTTAVIVSKESQDKNKMDFFFVKFPKYLDGRTLTLDRYQINEFVSYDFAPILSNLLIVGDQLIFGRRDDHLYFINLSIMNPSYRR